MANIDKETGEVLSDTGGELTLQDRAKLALKGNDAELIAIAKASSELGKIETKDHYAEIMAAEKRLVKIRLNITSIGKAARDDATKFSKAVIAEENRLIGLIEPEEERLKALRFDWDEAIRIENGRAFAEAEAKRVKLQAIDDALEIGLNFGDWSGDVQDRINAVNAAVIPDDFTPEVKQRLELKKLTTLNTLANALEAAKFQEDANTKAAQLKSLQDAENKQAAELAEANEKKRIALENAPDAEKLEAWVQIVKNVPFPVMSTTQGQQTKLDIIDRLDGLLDKVSIAARSMIDL
jgi:hypothetical protein